MRKATLTMILAAGCVVLFATPKALGGGIEIPMQSARAAGQADAFTAQADDPSAIFYNPAGLTQLKGTQVSAGAFFLFPDFHYNGISGDQQMTRPSVLPHLYAETDFGLERWRFGIGANNVFGLNEGYGNRGPLRTLVNKAQLSVINFAPAVAYKVDEHLSFGTAFNVYYGNLLLEKNAVVAAPPVPEGDFRLRGDAFSFGVTPGVTYKIDSRNQLGAYYRSPFTLDFSGKSNLKVPGVGQFGPSSTHESLHLPQSVGVGYSTRPTHDLNVEADVIWTDWHSVDQLKLYSADPHFNGQTIPASWKSGFTYRLGAEYKLTDHWALRGGYAFSQNSVPESTYSPLVPDSNYHLFAVGGGYSTATWSFDLAYQLIFRERRHIQNSVASPLVDGTWDNQIHGVLMTFTLKL
jgi:long-chain fatty acid transport protein